MSRKNVKLTAALVNGYKPKDKAYRVFDSTVTGLTLYVGTSGVKSWSINYTDRNSKRQSYRIGTTKKYNVVEARAEARKLLSDIAAGNDPAEKKRKDLAHKRAAESRKLITYLDGDYFTHWLSKRKSGIDTQKRIKSAFIPFLERDMDMITSVQLISHRTQRGNDGVKPQSLNRERATLHALFEKAVKAKIIKHNPANKHDFEPLEAIKSNRVRYLGMRDEIEGNLAGAERTRFMNALKTTPDMIKTLVGLALLTGCRRGELFNLKWSDITLRGTKPQLTVTAHSAKTSKQRTIVLIPEAVEILKKWRGNIVTLDGDALVFTNLSGKRLDNIKSYWSTLCERANVVDFRLHDCRHDFASRLVLAGVPLIKVRDLLGHSSIVMTERYAHLAPDDLRDAMSVLSAQS